MKRSAALAPLSRDHQHALDAALRLRRAEPQTLEDACARFHAFFADEGETHFAIEEALLLPALPRADGEWAAVVERIRDDHGAIRAAAETLRQDADVAGARALGERLADHVRYEERVAFELLERRLSRVQLEALGAAIEAAERAAASP